MAGEPYGRVVRTFWTDPDIKPLPYGLKTLLLYFDTSPHGNMIGVYHCPLEYAAKESGMSIEEVRTAVDGRLTEFLTYDHSTEEVFVHGGAKHCIGDELKIGPKGADLRIKNVENLLRTVHSPWLRQLFLARYARAYHLTGAPPEDHPPNPRAPSKPLQSPSEARAVAEQSSSSSSLASQAADAARKKHSHVDNSVDNTPHTLHSVLGLVVQRLYFGTRPSRAEMRVNGSVLKKLNECGRSWDLLARAVEGLALRRDRGELRSVSRTSPVSCKWLWDKAQDLNQVVVSEDALYRSGPDPPRRRHQGDGAAPIGAAMDDVLQRIRGRVE